MFFFASTRKRIRNFSSSPICIAPSKANGKKWKKLFNVCRLCSRFVFFFSPRRYLLVSIHLSFIIGGGPGWKIILCRQAAGRKILANLISDKSVISTAVVVVVRSSIRHSAKLARQTFTYTHSHDISRPAETVSEWLRVSSRKVQDEILPKVIKLSLSWTFFAEGSLYHPHFPPSHSIATRFVPSICRNER